MSSEKTRIEAQSKAVLEFFGEDPTNKPIKALFNFFVNKEVDQKKLERAIYKAMFYQFDKDGNGSLDKTEVIQLYRFLNEEREELYQSLRKPLLLVYLTKLMPMVTVLYLFDEFTAFMEKAE